MEASTFTILYPSDEWVLGPNEDEVPKFLVFLPLVERNADGQIVGRLARSWEHSEDYGRWTFHLRTDVSWHDGMPVTAHDAAFTYELWQRSSPDSARRTDYDVSVLNDSTFHITYHSRSYDPLDPWPVVYPRHLLESLDPLEFYRWEFWKAPIGNGPYRYVRHVPKLMVELEANPDFFEDRPAIRRIVLRFGGTNKLAELLGGSVDAIAYLHLADHSKLADNPSFRSYYGPPNPLWLNAIYWNQRFPPFRDSRVRRALTHAIDREQLLRALGYPAGTPVVDGIFTVAQHRRGELSPNLPHDLLLADSLLAAAGWVDTDGDGVRDREGQPFEFTAIVASHASLAASLERAAVIVQADLKRAGIQMEIQALENAAFQRTLAESDFDAALYLLRNAPNNPLSLQRLVSSESITGYWSPELARLVDLAYSAMDPAEKDSMHAEAAAIMREELPVTILFSLRQAHVAHRRIGGLASPYRANPARYADRLWIGGATEGPRD
jgi:peptide/nickel transport system substrate-binding protein